MPRKPFPVAELLLQNGADIPTEPSPFPLSDSAKMYLEFKNDQRLGKTNASAGKEANGDNLGPLPNMMVRAPPLIDTNAGSTRRTDEVSSPSVRIRRLL